MSMFPMRKLALRSLERVERTVSLLLAGRWKKYMKENVMVLPSPWCGVICKNAMNEVCLDYCALKRDTSAFEPKDHLTLREMPRFPKTEGMTKEEKFTSVTIYLSKIVDHLQGVEDEYATIVVRRPRADSETSSRIPSVVPIQDLLSGEPTADTTPQTREERQNQEVRPVEVAQPSS